MKYWILLLCFIAIGCTKIKENRNEKYYPSKGLYNYSIQIKDSLIYRYKDSLIISNISQIVKKNSNYLITDKGLKRIIVFNKYFTKAIKIIGKKGKGPGEYTSTPIIINGTKFLEISDFRKKKINIYSDNYKLIESKSIDPKFIYNSFSNLFVNNKYVLNSLYPFPVNKDAYYRKYKSLNLFNKDLTFYKSILDWDKIYTEPSLEGYSRNNLAIFCSPASKNEFFVIQGATYYINKIGADLSVVKKFGIKPLNYKDPPEGVKFKDTQKSFETLVEYYSHITIISNLAFDKKNKRIFLEYGNTTANTFLKKDKFLTDRYLQVYNSEYNCIFDGEIDGVFLFTDNGYIYILTDENPDFIKIKIYSLINKSAIGV